MANFGHARERQLVAWYRDRDWIAFRAPGSLGCADVLALKEGQRPLLIECKATAAGPFSGFGPVDRKRLIDTAALAGATPLLCWWPKRAKPRFLKREEWPHAR